ncbi:ribonuclease Z [Adhaeribacter radiodurans]|uniref:Ribonuclease Z n=1 Tax=Adhaeribacter radiodurans TaxID=2745197 RepID=A0A7L7L4G6_9BACT|nr:ribonuclease Z [Adhaeribacter radiodurans]QMU27485.1 ribonuclease Z [Adhaeribacter radiodurans]
MEFELKILGSSSATPSPDRHHTAQVLTIGNQINLIDCGENTQMQLMRYKVKHQRISNIFISHLHGDHFFGLFGLLSTMHLQQRTQPLNLFGPAGLDEILTTQFRYSHTQLSFKLTYHELDTTVHAQVFEDKAITVHTLPMQHRIDCCGFLFREKPKLRHLIKDKLPGFLTPAQLVRLKAGEDILDETGNLLVANADVTSEPNRSRSYAYCSDTRYKEDILPYIKQVDLLYHEATFLDELKEQAAYTMHSTALQAATLARKAEVKRLLIGHFSVRYRDLTPLLLEAKSVFDNTQLATEGKTISILE